MIYQKTKKCLARSYTDKSHAKVFNNKIFPKKHNKLKFNQIKIHYKNSFLRKLGRIYLNTQICPKNKFCLMEAQQIY